MRQPIQMVHRWHVRAVLRVIANVDQALFLELIKHLAARKRLEEHEFGVLGIELDGEIDGISYAVFCLKKKTQNEQHLRVEEKLIRTTDDTPHIVRLDYILLLLQDTVSS